MAEYKGFVVAVVFIIIFSALLSTMPTFLSGAGTAANEIIPVDPNIISGFSDSETYCKANFTPNLIGELYQYEMNSRYWQMQYDSGNTYFVLYERIIWLGIFVVNLDPYIFTSSNGTNRGYSLSFTEIDADMTDGTETYALKNYRTSNDGGSLIVWYNTTTYDNSSHAWDNSDLWFMHGIGFQSSATNDIGALLVSLLLFQLPDVPLMANVIIGGLLWVSIIWILWFVVKSMIPFLS